MIVTALAVDTKICKPSVFTLSGSSTPWTWTLVPVYEGVDWLVADASTVVIVASDMVPALITGPPNDPP